MASIFTLPAEKIDAQVVRDFVAQQNAEAIVLEYKRDLNDQTLRTIAAMANTSGGVLLVGVPERKGSGKGLPDSPVGVPLGDRDRLVSQCFAKLEPPFEPEIIPVALDEAPDRYVLVVRVDTERAHRPVVVGGTVYVRLAGQTQPADRYRMAALFAEGAPTTGAVPTIGRPRGGGGYPPLDLSAEAMVIRLTLQIRVPPGSSVLAGATRHALSQALEQSTIEKWLCEQSDIVGLRQERPAWIREGFITARSESLRRAPVRAVDGAATLAAQAAIELSAGHFASGWATLILDIVVRPIPHEERSQQDSFDYMLTLDELRDVIGMLLRVALDEIGSSLLSTLAGTHFWIPLQLTVALDTGTTPVTGYLTLPRWPRARDAEDRPGPFFETPPGTDPRDEDQRAALVREWIAAMLYNQGFSGFDEQLG